jgi:hypothetical protein
MTGRVRTGASGSVSQSSGVAAVGAERPSPGRSATRACASSSSLSTPCQDSPSREVRAGERSRARSRPGDIGPGSADFVEAARKHGPRRDDRVRQGQASPGHLGQPPDQHGRPSGSRCARRYRRTRLRRRRWLRRRSLRGAARGCRRREASKGARVLGGVFVCHDAGRYDVYGAYVAGERYCPACRRGFGVSRAGRSTNGIGSPTRSPEHRT